MTPRPYLSWSQMNLVETNEKAYIEQYVYGKKRGTNRGMAFGKTMAEGLERDEATGDPVLDMAMSKIPKFELMDKEFRITLEVGKYTVPLLIRPDTIKPDFSALKEYKTGPEGAWTQKKVDEDGQLTFYTVGAECISKLIPKDIELVQVITEKDEETGRIEATGDIKIFKTRRSNLDVLKMQVRMLKAWDKIQKIYSNELL